MVNLHEVTTVEGVSSLADEWGHVLSESSDRCLFLTHDWISLWWKHFGTGRQLRVIAVRESGKLVAILPLMSFRTPVFRPVSWFKVRALQTIGDYHSNRVDLICPDLQPRYLELIWERLLQLPGWYFLRIYPLLESSQTCTALRQLAEGRGLQAMFIPSQSSPYINTSLGWDKFVSGISREYRRKGRRAERDVAQEACTYRVVRGGSQLDEELDKVFAVDAKGWAGREGTGISSTAELRAFYRELAHLGARKGWLSLALVEIKGELAAYQFNFNYNRKIYNLKVAYDPRFRRSSPGHVASWFGISNAFEPGAGIDEWDFLGDQDPYKLEWTQTIRSHVKVCIYRPNSLYARFLYWLDAAPAEWVRHRVRRSR
ncbi:MAG: GNAT family N-acetyltransferase [Acidobacteriota bacterium]|nr:MAG: GNAT family N-acetyltransferase [Acidobacteriota bacterium]